MKLTVDTITDDQIRVLTRMPSRTIRKQRAARLVLVAVALGTRRPRRGDTQRKARARCAEILNARSST